MKYLGVLLADLWLLSSKNNTLNSGSWATPNPILHSFTINMGDMAVVPMMLLHEKLRLDVSEGGIIGRGVTVLIKGREIGVGTVGWQ